MLYSYWDYDENDKEPTSPDTGLYLTPEGGGNVEETIDTTYEAPDSGNETWFPFFIIPPKRLNRMWVDGQGDRPVVLSPGFQSQKIMFTVLFNYSGPLVVGILPQNTTMTTTYYVQNVLS
ncbi:transposase [Elysia marginata]|uniref:Transposase n=1 Tax=Elysia marginata TaxID=1093978 RepID=A0AAV4FGM7_9GAST|nr:transposase [Elysia marginata]